MHCKAASISVRAYMGWGCAFCDCASRKLMPGVVVMLHTSCCYSLHFRLCHCYGCCGYWQLAGDGSMAVVLTLNFRCTSISQSTRMPRIFSLISHCRE